MTLANTLLLIHIVAVIVLIGGAVFLGILFARVRSAANVPAMRALLEQSEFLGKAVFNPAGIITLSAGIWLAIEADWDFSEPFITLGFVGIAVGAILGMGFYPGVTRAALAGLDETGDIGDPAVSGPLDRLRVVSLVELLILLVVVWSMVFKPGT